MLIRRFVLNVCRDIEKELNTKLRGSVGIHVVDAPNSLDEIFIYAFYPEETPETIEEHIARISP